MDNKISIPDTIYRNNLNFYTLIKLLIQSKLSGNQLLLLQNLIQSIDDRDVLLDSIQNFGKNKLDYVFAWLQRESVSQFFDYLDLAVDLLLLKDLIIKESKVFVEDKFKKEISKVSDYLSIEYDVSGLSIPYGQRVVGALLVFALTNIRESNKFLLDTSENRIKDLLHKSEMVASKYVLNTCSIFQIIVDESINQSIKADAGIGYETRVVLALTPLVDKIFGHSHDSKISSVEYDNTFLYNNKLCGISAKRTLRERYKQNHKDVDLLDVDYMFVITLGTDLNITSMNNILNKNGNFIIVSKEQYELKSFLNENEKVIPSDKILEYFNKIIV